MAIFASVRKIEEALTYVAEDSCSKKSDIGIQVKPEVVSKGTCVFVSIREKATQIKRVFKKSVLVSVLVKPSQVSMTSKLQFVNASTQTDEILQISVLVKPSQVSMTSKLQFVNASTQTDEILQIFKR